MSSPKKEDGNYIEIPTELLPGIKELTGDLRNLAELVGVATAIKIGMHFDGVPLRLWGIARFRRRLRDNHIRKEYDQGAKAIDLARKYGVSERWVWDILGRCDATVKTTIAAPGAPMTHETRNQVR